MAELGTSGSVDGYNQLLIKGRFQQKNIEGVLKRYIRKLNSLIFYLTIKLANAKFNCTHYMSTYLLINSKTCPLLYAC